MNRIDFVKNIPRPKADLRKGVRIRWRSTYHRQYGDRSMEIAGEGSIVEVLPDGCVFRVKDDAGKSLIKCGNELERI